VSQSTTAPPPANPNPPTASLDLAAEFIDRSTPLTRIRGVLHRYPAISPAVVLVIAIIVFGVINGRFLAPANLSLITQQVAVIGTIGVAETLIILTAGIDLSVGAAMVLSSIVMGNLAAGRGFPPLLALLVGLLVGLATGALNGALVTRLNLPPFIVTLGTLSIFTALYLLYSNGATVQGDQISELITWTGLTFRVLGVDITFGVLLMIVLYAVVAFALGRTAWGRHVYAVGDDKEAARLTGIRVNRLLLSVYIAAGAILALAAWIQVGRDYGASPNAAADANLNAITAVVIGGTSLFGGRGAVWGTLLGALIVGVFRNGLALAGLDVLYQTLAVGVLVIVAVAIDQWIRKVRK
jgi:fructose transport system permease protein